MDKEEQLLMSFFEPVKTKKYIKTSPEVFTEEEGALIHEHIVDWLKERGVAPKQFLLALGYKTGNSFKGRIVGCNRRKCWIVIVFNILCAYEVGAKKKLGKTVMLTILNYDPVAKLLKGDDEKTN